MTDKEIEQLYNNDTDYLQAIEADKKEKTAREQRQKNKLSKMRRIKLARFSKVEIDILRAALLLDIETDEAATDAKINLLEKLK